MVNELNLKIYRPNAIYILYDGTTAYDVYGCDVKDEIELNGAEVLKGPFADTPENNEKVEAYIEQYNKEITNNGMNENKSMKKNVKRINESQLNTIVTKATKKALNEIIGSYIGTGAILNEFLNNPEINNCFVDRNAVEKFVRYIEPYLKFDYIKNLVNGSN